MLQFEKMYGQIFYTCFVAFKTRCIVNSLTTYLVTKPENFEFVRQTGQIPVASLEEAWLLAQQELAKQGKDDYKITIMGHASATMPVLGSVTVFWRESIYGFKKIRFKHR